MSLLRKMFICLFAILFICCIVNEQIYAQKTHPIVEMATGTPTGSWFPTGAAVADMTNKFYEGQPISVVPGAGSVGNITRVGNEKSDMGMSYGAFLKLAMQGGNAVNPGQGFEDLRAIMAMTPYVLHILVANDLKANNFQTLLEKKSEILLGTGVTGSTEHFGLNLILKEHGSAIEKLKEAGARVHQTNTSGRKNAWKNRQLNMADFMFTPPHPVIHELMGARKSQLIGLNDEVIQSLHNQYGFLVYEIGSNDYEQQNDTIKTVGFPMVIFGTDELSEELVYDMVKSVAEGKERMIKAAATFEEWNPQDMPKGLGIEIHKGALKYYKERGWIK